MWRRIAPKACLCGLFLTITPSVEAGAPVRGRWNDCPRGLADDPAPGACGKYVDTDKDGICDRSQPPPGERAKASGGTPPAARNAPRPAAAGGGAPGTKPTMDPQ